ncbi:MAG: rRNA maturation RNAse YbeY, partial [Bacillota bacterium]|nr:rRNA maturation RNAse YbeY [Bacillota bacterium]
MSLILDITDETGRVPEDRLAEIEKLLQFAAAEEGVADGAEVSVTIVNNEEIQKINKEYR